jgi:hypothetical protein
VPPGFNEGEVSSLDPPPLPPLPPLDHATFGEVDIQFEFEASPYEYEAPSPPPFATRLEELPTQESVPGFERELLDAVRLLITPTLAPPAPTLTEIAVADDAE